MESTSLVGLDTTNLILGILAATAVAECLIIGLLAVWVRRRIQHVSDEVAELSAKHVLPTMANIRRVSDKAGEVLAGAEAIVSRVTGVADALDGRVRSAAAGVGHVVKAIDGTIGRSRTQVHALEAGLARGLDALRRPRR